MTQDNQSHEDRMQNTGNTNKKEGKRLNISKQQPGATPISPERELMQSKLRADALAFVSDHEPDVKAFMDFFGQRVLELAKCDQVIYRSIDGNRMVYNAPGIKDIPQDVCARCPFVDLNHEAYGDDGMVLMNDSRDGCRGVSAPKDCPSRSSVMCHVYVGGKVAGALAVHYLKTPHTFSADGIDIMNTVCKFLGLLLDRIEAKKIVEEQERQLAQNNQRIMALEDNFEALYDVELESGRYTAFVRGDYYQSKVVDKLLNGDDFFKDLRKDIESVVYKEDIDGLYNLLTKEAIQKGLSENDRFEHFYRIPIDNVPRWHKIRVVYKSKAKNNVIIGVFNAEKEMAQRAKEVELQQSLMQNYQRIMALEDNLESIYEVELESGNYTEYVKGEFYQSNVADKLLEPGDYFEDLRENIDAVIYPEDRDALFNVLCRENIRNGLAETDRIEHYYRMFVGETPIWFKIRIVYKDEAKTTVVIGCFNAQKELETKQIVEQREKIAEQAAFTNFFFDTYASAYYIDLETLTYKIYKNPDGSEPDYLDIRNYLDSIKEYINRDVHPDDRQELIDLASPERVREILKEKAEYYHIFRQIFGGKERIYRMQVIRGADEKHAAFGFKDITEEVTKEQEEQRKLEETLKEVQEVNGKLAIAHKVMRSGEWAYGINENDDVVSAQYADITLNALNKKFGSNPMAWLEFVHPDDRERVGKGFMAAIYDHSGKTIYDETFRVLMKDGVYKWTKSTGKLIRNEDGTAELIGMNININDQIEAERRNQEKLEKAYNLVQEEARRTDILYKASNSGKWSYDIDENDQVVDVHYSDKVLQLVKNDYSGDPLKWIDYLHPDDKERVTAAFWAAIHDHSGQTPYDTTFRLLSVNGKISWIKTSGRLLRHNNGTSELIGLSINITDQIERERRHQEELQKAVEAAQAANSAKTAFMNNMSHDIRTPMNAIIGYTSMAQKYIKDTERTKDYLGKISIAGNNLLGLINQVLDMSRIESGKITLEEVPVDLMARSSELIEIVDNSAKLKNIRMTTQIHDIHNTRVYADPARMNQLLMNILGNAIKYTPEGGSIRHIVTQTDCDRPGYGRYVIVVEDNGIGMSKEYLETIFEPFSRENTSTVSKIQGTGLGMAIVKRLVDLMGGTINVESEQGKGTKITIALELRLQEKKTDEAAKQKDDQEISAGRFKDKRILLVEDNEMNREIASVILEEHGMIVETADDGDVAVDKIQTLAECGELDYFDAILMDIQMPRLGGYEATGIIRKTVPELKTPIIAVSANAFEEDKKKSREAGMDAHIAKPIDVPELLHTLAKYIK